jgi:hypothetical protein
MSLVFYRLDHTVLSPRNGSQALAELAYGLVVPGLYQETGRTQDAGEPAVPFHSCAMFGGETRWAPVFHCILDRLRDVGMEITAACHVEHLHAPADAEDRAIRTLEGRVGKLELEHITLAANGVNHPVRVTAVGLGIDVAAARQDEAVDEVKIVLGIGVPGGKCHRDSTGTSDGVDVATRHSERRRRPGARVRGDADDGTTRWRHGAAMRVHVFTTRRYSRATGRRVAPVSGSDPSLAGVVTASC